MNHSPIEDRLREALTEAGATLDPGTLRPLRAPERRFRVNHRLVTAAAAVVLAGTAAAVGLGGPGDVDHAVATNPESLPIDQADMVVQLCTKTTCDGNEATPEQMQAIEQAVRQLPEVEVVVFEGQVLAYNRFRQEFANDQELLDKADPADFPPSFRLKLKEGTAPSQVSAALRKLPGLYDVVDREGRRDLVEKAGSAPNRRMDISVFLCGRESSWPACGAERTYSGEQDFEVAKEGKAATEAEKTALRTLIERMPEVDSFVYEDQKAAYENFRMSFKANKKMINETEVKDMPESFRLKLRPEADADKVVSLLIRQPGVSSVGNNKCMRDNVQMIYDYGLSTAAVCPSAN
ncbi:permease-like cell division protein FtsX [Nonomuraea sp. B5E05]|uniref:permease-like cell division protein FtsX n=1 Tax=Nonomuraea sp. B5E05 TaxID=3153569 RepID=UPI003261CC9E